MIRKIIYNFVFTVLLFVGTVHAAPLPAQFFVNAFEANVGDKVEFTLKVNPSNDKPVYTVISNLEYDKNLLTFSGAQYSNGWVSIPPEEVTDSGNGIVKRAAGYPTGLRSLETFAKFSFVAKAPGKAVVNVLGGSAYDAESNDYGLQNKTITVNIGQAKPKVVEKEDVKAEPEKKISQLISLSFAGLMAAVADRDFTFTVGHKLSEKVETKGVTRIGVVNTSGVEVYTQENVFETNDDVDVLFTIPSKTLSQGNYTLIVDSKYNNQTGTSTFSKDFGVVDSVEKIVKEDKVVEKIPVWYWVLLAVFVVAFLYTFAYLKSKKLRKFIKDF